MPASLFHENQEQINQNIQNTNVSSVNGIEEQRALQLALELSVFGLMNDEDSHLNAAIDAEARLKKSQNTTECVPVPSSEHVAEIVGRQGCKIKALRAKTNTYIKTPVRGEEPVFVVTGRKEDVNSAKREILSAAEHFSQIRAQRKSTIGGVVGAAVANALSETNTSLTNSVCNATGQCTIQVRVPYRVVGLVVGPKGATIKRIQQQTSTYIITPSREKEPIFEVTGLPDNVQTARKEIEAHIAIRTGDVIDSGSSGNGSSQADDLDTRDYLSNSPQQFGSFVEQLYGGSSVNNGQQTGNSSNAANVAAVAAKLNGLQLLQNCNTNSSATNNSNSFSNIFASAASLAALNNNNSNGSTTNGLSLLYSKANGSLENSFSPFSLNGLGASNKNSDMENNCSNLFNNFGVDALTRNNILNHNVNGNSGGASTINSLSSGSSNSSTSSNGNLNASNNLMNLCNSTGLNMLNLQNAKNLLSVNSNFADIYSQLLANKNNLTSSTSNNNSSSNHNHHLNHNHQLLQHHHLNNAASAVVNQLSNALGQLNVNNVSNSNSTNGNNSNTCSLTGNSTASNLLNSSNNSTGASTLNGTGNNSFNVNSLYERDEGIGDSPTFDSIAAANLATLTSNLAVMASVNSSNHSSNSSGLGSSNGLLSGLTSSSGNSSSASSVNSTNNSVSLWPDFSSATSNTVNNSTTNINNSTNNQCNTNSTTMNNSSNSTNVSSNVANSLATVTSISTAQQQQVSRA